MAAAREIIWPGASGATYKYWIYPINDFRFKEAPGNYIFARETSEGHYAIYVGETGDLSERFDNHHKAKCIIANGATHIHAHTSSHDDDARRREEKDIIVRWEPKCND
jgi:hypothetical protein